MKNYPLLLAIIALLLLFGTVACSDSEYNKAENVSDESDQLVYYYEKIPGKLYYITHKHNSSDFVVKYNAFLTQHPELRVISTENVLDNAFKNEIKGVFIFTEEK